VQKYGKKECRQIFRGLFFHGKLVVINKFAEGCERGNSDAESGLRRAAARRGIAAEKGGAPKRGNFFCRKLIN
jgi:hypothetical protein